MTGKALPRTEVQGPCFDAVEVDTAVMDPVVLVAVSLFSVPVTAGKMEIALKSKIRDDPFNLLIKK